MHPALGGRPAGPSARASRRAGRCRERPVRAVVTAQGTQLTRTRSQVPKRSGARTPAHPPLLDRVGGYPGRPSRLPAGRGLTCAHGTADMLRAGKRTPRPAAWNLDVLARGLDARAGSSVHRPHRTDTRRRGQDTIPPGCGAGRSRA